jgi:hypothetical protein
MKVNIHILSIQNFPEIIFLFLFLVSKSTTKEKHKVL